MAQGLAFSPNFYASGLWITQGECPSKGGGGDRMGKRRDSNLELEGISV